MTLVFVLLATLTGSASALLFYLAAPQQQWRAAGPWPSRHGWVPGTLCALASLLATLRVMAPMEAVFAWAVLLTLVLSIAPLLGAWRAAVRDRRGACVSAKRERLQSRHWLGKTLAATVPGYTLALALSGIIALLTPDGFVGEGKVQFNMWMIAPAWATVLGFVFLFRDGLRAWLWLGVANVVAWGLFWGLRAWLQ